MAAKAIYEVTGKSLLNSHLPKHLNEFPRCTFTKCRFVSVREESNLEEIVSQNPWLTSEKLVAKPDQLIKRRGKLGLIQAGVDLPGVRDWLSCNMGKTVQIDKAEGTLENFIIEPFVPHDQSDEYYVCIYSTREGETILFHDQGGIDIGNVEEKALSYDVTVDAEIDVQELESQLLVNLPIEKRSLFSAFIVALHKVYNELYFTYLEINPLVVVRDRIHVLDIAAKLDATAEYLCKQLWGEIIFPPPFGRKAYPEEAYIADLDAKSGASLKLTILNKRGRIWTMVAGGGASVVYSDTICDMGGGDELANYGEYSGAPSESQTYEYAKTILGLMTEESHPNGKILIIGGGIANFTNVASTFKGIVRALTQYQHKLVEQKISIFVRRGGPNYQEGLRVMREVGGTLGVPVHVYGPETHMTAIVGMALEKVPVVKEPMTSSSLSLFNKHPFSLSNPSLAETDSSSIVNGKEPDSSGSKSSTLAPPTVVKAATAATKAVELEHGGRPLFTCQTRAMIWGMHPRAVQGMLDFDHVCRREFPSVVAMIYPFSGNHNQKFYWGRKEIMVPVYKEMCEAMKRHPEVDVLVNFASLRSAYESTMEAMTFPQIRAVAIIAEGIPENLTKKLIKTANAKGVSIIGPATVGGVKAGCFKIGNSAGMLDNIISAKLFRPGSVAYVSRSGGMSNELNNIIARSADGIYVGVAIGGDRYPGTTFIDHILRYESNPNVKIIVLLGEVGGIEEYKICEALQDGRITKPLIAWCMGTCAKMFTSEVQFGHAGACANAEQETAEAKNKALTDAGAYVPYSFDDLPSSIKEVYDQLVDSGAIVPQPEVEPPSVPMDYSWAQELGLIRKSASFMSSICDERGEELLYAGMPITSVFKEDIGIGGVISLLWFQRRLPAYACKFVEMCLMVSADHGPAVSGAHNTIVTARAGKDLISSLTSGLLTIGDRFGGALDAAARQFSEAYDGGVAPMEFVNSMRRQHKLIMGIGHRVKSLNNPDMRVTIMKDFVIENFPSHPLLDYALQVEKITTNKKPNLILNVDGCIAVAFVDLLRTCGAFSSEEAREYIETGCLNGLFVLGRTIGFIGHYLDQRRLKQGLYRHPWDDISYVLPQDLQ